MARFLIVGAGGVGGLLGGLLSLAGEQVSFVVRGKNLAALKSEGLVLRGDAGEQRTGPLRAAESPEQLGTVDYVLVALKTWQLPAMAPRLKPVLGPDTLVVPLQNGVEAAAHLAAALGPGPVAGGLCHMLSYLEAPGVVRWSARPLSVTLGALQPAQASRLAALQKLFERAGISALLPEDFEAALWSKLLFVGPYGAVGAAAGKPAGGMRSDPRTRAQLEGAMTEIAQLARARGVRLPEDVVGTAMARLDSLPPEATASLHRDIVAGRPSELEEWMGAVVRLGAQSGVPTPVCGALYAELLPRERAARAAAGDT
ncbi:2-dehydropantoate 2-reductase [Aggregicoccus sp. 17bor-14]|uniref:2-dehydropantoate 2-reductase n=1 Tax=Myxococcaceae TaxID=31 RepID=UPI00129CA1BB|nr:MULTISPECIES: 2-dehydropantoate 2-reductase [Myxococcaceae]MBF5042169.1 2-dehydropantoate 2-reductase [Simulacricoccus sp. 17bor-14]MRI87946.1 2-dehydropantoate 2-reductase [Aggregicoccus sp. 17bor-14]